MGTNYYWFRDKIETRDVLPEEGLHIGKNSAGWVFNFQAYQSVSLWGDPAHFMSLGTYCEYREFLKEGYIYDEYGEYIPYEEFLRIVKESKEPENGQQPLCKIEPICHGIMEWTNDGFMFTLNDFS